MKYPIYEHFLSWQGEGVHCGKSAYFVRTYGCPIKCEWCDSAGTWHKDYIPKEIAKLTSEEIFALFNKISFNFLVITGGEPAIFNWSSLISYVKERSYLNIHLETSGAFEIKGNFDWITVSPKQNHLPLEENLNKANEIKIIVENENSIKEWIEKFPILKNKKNVWLHPEWSKRRNAQVLDCITKAVKNYCNFRAGYQIHKLYQADALDINSKSLVPLGGNLALGL